MTLDTLGLRQQGVAATPDRAGDGHAARRHDRPDAAAARLRHRQPDRAGPDRRHLRRRRSPSRPCRSRSPTPSSRGLGLAGTVNGTARVTGPRADARTCASTVAVAGVASAMTRGAGLPPVALDATRHDGGRPAQPRRHGRRAGRARRPAPRARCRSAPATSTSRSTCSPSRWRSSTGSPATAACAARSPARARVTGPLADPAVQLRPARRGPERDGAARQRHAAARRSPPPATSAASAVTLTHGAGDRRAAGSTSGSGRMPLAGPGLDVALTGTVPLVDRQPAARGARSRRRRACCGSTPPRAGSLAAPQLGGTASLAGGTFVDPGTNLRLEGIGSTASLEGSDAVLRSFSADVATGGPITARGPGHARRRRRLPGRPQRPHQRRPLHRRRLRLDPALGRAGAARPAGRRRRAARRAASTSAAPRSRSPRASAPARRRALDQVDHMRHAARRCR